MAHRILARHNDGPSAEEIVKQHRSHGTWEAWLAKGVQESVRSMYQSYDMPTDPLLAYPMACTSEHWRHGLQLYLKRYPGANKYAAEIMYNAYLVRSWECFVCMLKWTGKSDLWVDNMPLVSALTAYDPPCYLEALLLKGADVDTPDDIGRTPIMYAARHASVNHIHLLMRYGAHVLKMDANNHHIMHHALLGMTMHHIPAVLERDEHYIIKPIMQLLLSSALPLEQTDTVMEHRLMKYTRVGLRVRRVMRDAGVGGCDCRSISSARARRKCGTSLQTACVAALALRAHDLMQDESLPLEIRQRLVFPNAYRWPYEDSISLIL